MEDGVGWSWGARLWLISWSSGCPQASAFFTCHGWMNSVRIRAQLLGLYQFPYVVLLYLVSAHNTPFACGLSHDTSPCWRFLFKLNIILLKNIILNTFLKLRVNWSVCVCVYVYVCFGRENDVSLFGRLGFFCFLGGGGCGHYDNPFVRFLRD